MPIRRFFAWLVKCLSPRGFDPDSLSMVSDKDLAKIMQQNPALWQDGRYVNERVERFKAEHFRRYYRGD